MSIIVVKGHKLTIVLLVYCGIACSATNDLAQVNNSVSAGQNPPALPILQAPKTNYKPIESGLNLFDQTRLDSQADSDLNKFNLNQVQMVGYMNYLKTDYAFLKTPYETLKVKVGDRILSGKVTLITANKVEVDELQIQDNKVFTNKIFINLDKSKEKKLPKLQTQ